MELQKLGSEKKGKEHHCADKWAALPTAAYDMTSCLQWYGLVKQWYGQAAVSCLKQFL
jgi:hypothetical protein